MQSRARVSVAALMLAGWAVFAAGQQKEPPKTWVDRDTGHRGFRVTDEPGSSGVYFNVNAYSPDGSMMVYTAPDGIHVMELATRKMPLLVQNPKTELFLFDRGGEGCS